MVDCQSGVPGVRALKVVTESSPDQEPVLTPRLRLVASHAKDIIPRTIFVL